MEVAENSFRRPKPAGTCLRNVMAAGAEGASGRRRKKTTARPPPRAKARDYELAKCLGRWSGWDE